MGTTPSVPPSNTPPSHFPSGQKDLCPSCGLRQKGVEAARCRPCHSRFIQEQFTIRPRRAEPAAQKAPKPRRRPFEQIGTPSIKPHLKPILGETAEARRKRIGKQGRKRWQKANPKKERIRRNRMLKRRADRRRQEHQAVPPEAAKLPVGGKFVTITLQLMHRINGLAYGPGQVTVEERVAQGLLGNESAAMRAEMKAVQSRAFIITSGPRGLVRKEIPVGHFNRAMELEPGLAAG